MYSPQLLDHFHNPRNPGKLFDCPGGTARFDRCGDRLEVTFRIEQGRVIEAKFRATGCGATLAAGSAGTELIVGRTVEEARSLSAFELDRALGGVPPSKRHALLMFLDCLAQGLGSRQTAPPTGASTPS